MPEASSSKAASAAETLNALCHGVVAELGQGWEYAPRRGVFPNGILSRRGGIAIEACLLPGDIPLNTRVHFCACLPRRKGDGDIRLRDTGALGEDQAEPAVTIEVLLRPKTIADTLQRGLIKRLEKMWPAVMAGMSTARARSKARVKEAAALAELVGAVAPSTDGLVSGVVEGIPLRFAVEPDGRVKFERFTVADARTAKAVLRALGARGPNAPKPNGIPAGEDPSEVAG